MEAYYNCNGDFVIVEDYQIVFTMVASECTGNHQEDVKEYKRLCSLIEKLDTASSDRELELLEELL